MPWLSATAVLIAITSRLNSDRSMPACPCVTPVAHRRERRPRPGPSRRPRARRSSSARGSAHRAMRREHVVIGGDDADVGPRIARIACWSSPAGKAVREIAARIARRVMPRSRCSPSAQVARAPRPERSMMRSVTLRRGVEALFVPADARRVRSARSPPTGPRCPAA
jgi:hypothetical protein